MDTHGLGTSAKWVPGTIFPLGTAARRLHPPSDHSFPERMLWQRLQPSRPSKSVTVGRSCSSRGDYRLVFSPGISPTHVPVGTAYWLEGFVSVRTTDLRSGGVKIARRARPLTPVVDRVRTRPFARRSSRMLRRAAHVSARRRPQPPAPVAAAEKVLVVICPTRLA